VGGFGEGSATKRLEIDGGGALHVVDDGGDLVVGLRDRLLEDLTHDNVPQVADKGSSSLGEGERVAL